MNEPKGPNATAPRPPTVDVDPVAVHIGDCVDVLRRITDASVDAVITDPPYAIRAQQPAATRFRGSADTCATCNRVPKAGYTLCGPCLALADERLLRNASMLGMQSQNWHEQATHSRGYADNDNEQFQRWCHLWLVECLRILKPGGHLLAFGGTRTWHRLAVATEDAGFEIRDHMAWLYGTGMPKSHNVGRAVAKLSNDKSWEGWGTSLKPAHEPIVVARKPIPDTVAHNVLTHGTGALNIEATRTKDTHGAPARWPNNVLLSPERATELDHQAGSPASRFFWVAKPSQQERITIDGIAHPTVKPLELMQRLVRLVTVPNGLVVDPFAGSGTTAEACVREGRRAIAIERDIAYLPLIQRRLERNQQRAARPGRPHQTPAANDPANQPALFG